MPNHLMHAATGVATAALAVTGCAGATDTRTDRKQPAVSLASRPAENAPLPKVCDLLAPRTVAELFEGQPRPRRTGPFPATCSYTLADRPEFEVLLSDLGRPAAWSRVRAAADRNSGGVEPVQGLGQAAFAPADAAGQEVVVLTDAGIVAVSAFTSQPDSALADRVVGVARAVSSNAASDGSAS